MPAPPQPIGRRPIMARGSHGEPVFADDTDRKRFLETLGEACARTGWRIHPCVLVGIRVAVVEDSADMRAGLQRMFSEVPGFACLSVHANAESALRALPGERPEVVLMDISLAGMDGIRCVRRLKADLPGTVCVVLRNVYATRNQILGCIIGP